MTAEVVQGIAGAALLLAISTIGYLVVRAINSVDAALSGLTSKVDSLSAKDTQVEVRLAELSVRLVRVEMDIAQMMLASKGRTG